MQEGNPLKRVKDARQSALDEAQSAELTTAKKQHVARPPPPPPHIVDLANTPDSPDAQAKKAQEAAEEFFDSFILKGIIKESHGKELLMCTRNRFKQHNLFLTIGGNQVRHIEQSAGL